jgi:hypothetical protein
MSDLFERELVKEVVTRLFVYTDDRNWSGVRECLADRVHYDIESMTGDQPKTLPAAIIITGWEAGLEALDAIHHQIGNLLVSVGEGSASVFCYGIASHYLPNATGQNTRTFVGSYDLHLVKMNDEWKIDRFRFILKYIDGNPDLENS